MAKRRPQGDGTIRKRSDGRWEARIIVGHKNDGSPMYKSAFAKTQKSALKQLHQLIDLYRDVDLTEDSRMTLGEWLDKWLDEYMIFTIRESTLDSYRAMVKNQVKPFIGSQISLFRFGYLTIFLLIQKNSRHLKMQSEEYLLLGQFCTVYLLMLIHLQLYLLQLL